MKRLIAQDRFEELKATGQLPSPKGVALAVINLMQRDDVTIADISRVVQTDPALSGRLIKFANSARQGVQRPVAAVAEAVLLLGLPLVRQLVLGFSVLSNFRHGRCKGFDYPAFWAHSLATAIANQMLSLHSQTAANETFTCGLMSQVGRLALATLFPEEYAEILEQAADKPIQELIRLEQERFATDHRELAVALLKDWGLPAVFLDAVFHHSDPDQGDFTEGSRLFLLTNALGFSSQVADACLADEHVRGESLEGLYRLGEQFQMDKDAVNSFCDRVAAEWRDWGQILDVPTQQLPSFADLAASVRQQSTAGEAERIPQGDYSLRILVVDSDAKVRAFLQDALGRAGHEVIAVDDGQEALRQALANAPRLIIADRAAAGMDGATLCKALRATSHGERIYFIMLASSQDEAQLVEAFEAGADDCLVKPFSERALQARLRAGQRVVRLQEAVEREQEEVSRVANELAVTNRRLQQMALTDPLTLLPNRRCGIEHFEQAWAAAVRSDRPLACLVIDIDHFKQINDTHGHGVGDGVLQQGAAILKESCRKQDLVSRLGGEEFMVVCPDTDLEAAARCAERIRLAVESCAVHVAGVNCRMTVSIGVAARDRAMNCADILLKVADKALYAAKQAGRNRVVCVGPPTADGSPSFRLYSKR